jgi:hypothetical protein
MGNKIRIKQIDLQGIFSASSQVDILSASNYASFVTQLDTTMSSDSELAAVSSSISQSIYTINQVIGSGLVSGSSQLTSSYDTRYILSGSITQTTWDNIEGKPSGLVSQSTDLTSLNSKTGSYATTGSNTFNGNQTITGSVSILIPGGTATGVNENPTSNNVFWSLPSQDTNTLNVAIGWTAVVQGGGTYTVTNVELNTPFAPFVAITLSDPSLTLGYRVRLDFSKNSKLWQFNTDGTLTGLPSGLISGSSQISGFGFISQSTDITSLNTFTASYFTDSSSFDTRITTEKGRIDSILSASTADIDTFAEIVSLINSVDLTNDNAFASFYTASNARLSSIENATGSYITSLNGAISSSSQLTSSFDARYTLSGSVVNSNINTGSFATTGSNTFNGNQTITGSLIVSSVAVVSGGINVPTGSTLSLTSGSNIFVDSSGGITGSFSGSVFGIGDVTAFSSSVNSRINSITSSAIPAGTISGSSQLTSSFDTRYTLSGSVQPLPNGLISGSSQLTSSFDTRYAPSASYLTSLNGAISGSSQLTASYDTRYTLSGSVVSGTTPAGTISGSSQLTSSFDGRYVQTGSFNSLTASFNSFTASAQSVTTGSNSFNGTQTITGSLIITTGSFFASQITANTASLYLTSGSNMYVQNNGVVEITGSLRVSGSAAFNVNVLSVDGRNGDEGGEINLAIPVTNTTLQNRVNVDIWQNRLRIFEGSAGANGVFIDLSKPTGNNNEITYKASGLVNAGDFVQLDNIKATITTTGNRGLSLATVSGTFVCNIAGNYAGAVVGVSGTSGTATITTSASTSIFGWGFTTQGDIATYIITDTTNSRAYRITIQIGGSYLNNLVSIERLH